MGEKEPWHEPLRRSLVSMPDVVFLSTTLLAIGIIVFDSINDLRNTNQRDWAILAIIDFVLLAYFVLVLADSHSKSEERSVWWKYNFLSVVALFPLLGTSIPGFSGASILRFLLLIPAIQAIVRMLNPDDGSEVTVQRRMVHLFLIISLITLAGAVLTLMFELQFEDECVADITCDEGQLVLNLEDAIWWAIETTTTVGYGEFIPKSLGARVVASVLLFAGVGLVGTLAGTMSHLFFSREIGRNIQRDDYISKLHLLTELHDRGDLSDSQFVRTKQRLLESHEDDERALSELDAPRQIRSTKKSSEISNRQERLDEAKKFFDELGEIESDDEKP